MQECLSDGQGFFSISEYVWHITAAFALERGTPGVSGPVALHQQPLSLQGGQQHLQGKGKVSRRSSQACTHPYCCGTHMGVQAGSQPHAPLHRSNPREQLE